MQNRRPRNDTRPGTTYSVLSRLPLANFFRVAISERRHKTGERFKGPYDAGRLIVLGILLIDLAVIAGANAVLDDLVIEYRPGMASLFAGLLLSIIVIRLGRPKLYLDWIANGVLHVCLGLILARDPYLVSTWYPILFYLLLMACALMTTWIGLTMGAEEGRPAFLAGGISILVVAISAIVDAHGVRSIAPDVVLAASLLLLGLSTGALGMALRKRT